MLLQFLPSFPKRQSDQRLLGRSRHVSGAFFVNQATTNQYVQICSSLDCISSSLKWETWTNYDQPIPCLSCASFHPPFSQPGSREDQTERPSPWRDGTSHAAMDLSESRGNINMAMKKCQRWMSGCFREATSCILDATSTKSKGLIWKVRLDCLLGRSWINFVNSSRSKLTVYCINYIWVCVQMVCHTHTQQFHQRDTYLGPLLPTYPLLLSILPKIHTSQIQQWEHLTTYSQTYFHIISLGTKTTTVFSRSTLPQGPQGTQGPSNRQDEPWWATATAVFCSVTFLRLRVDSDWKASGSTVDGIRTDIPGFWIHPSS